MSLVEFPVQGNLRETFPEMKVVNISSSVSQVPESTFEKLYQIALMLNAPKYPTNGQKRASFKIRFTA